jgi:FXSXX-COOH protein
MISKNQELRSVIPDLRDLPPDQLAVLGDSVLARSLALYRQRLEENGELLSAFNAKIEVSG